MTFTNSAQSTALLSKHGHINQVLDVIVLDDNDFDLRRMARIFDQISLETRVQTCSTLEIFKDALDAKIFDICLIDHHLGQGENGKDALEFMRTHRTNCYTPAVLVSGTTDPSVIVESIRGGFANFVDKDALSVARLAKVVSEALNEAAAGELQDHVRNRLLSRVLKEFADTYADHTRPHLSAIYKQVDFVRRCVVQKQLPDPGALDKIEDHCFEIWRFLDDYPNHGFGNASLKH